MDYKTQTVSMKDKHALTRFLGHKAHCILSRFVHSAVACSKDGEFVENCAVLL